MAFAFHILTDILLDFSQANRYRMLGRKKCFETLIYIYTHIYKYFYIYISPIYTYKNIIYISVYIYAFTYV